MHFSNDQRGDFMSRKYQQIVPGTKFWKRTIASLVFWFLGRAIRAAVRLDPIVRKEFNSWNDSATIILKINDFGPALGLQKQGEKLVKINAKKLTTGDLVIYFKNVDTAVLILLGHIGVADGFAQHRFLVKGDIGFSLSFVRILYIVEDYLFPSFITKKILKQKPKKGSSRLKIYLATLLGIN